jgi:hypothetical protein
MQKDGKGLIRAGDLDFLRRRVENTPPATPDPPPIPTEPHLHNQQLSLWQNFLANDSERDKLSNAIDLWDSVPKYSISRQAMSKTRMMERFLEKYTSAFHHRGREYSCTITPARVIDLDGKERDFYPSATEELIEEALRKISTDQQSGFFDKPNFRSGVLFSMYALREELARHGHTRSYQEIRHALDVMSTSIIEITVQNERGEVETIRSAYLPAMASVTRNKLRDDPQAKWAVQFHPFVTAGIDQLNYRQFDYVKLMSHRNQLTRWLHKYLIFKWPMAELSKTFEIRYSTVKRDSGLLNNYTRERAAIDALDDAFNELKEKDILYSFERQNITGLRNKIFDVVFTLHPSISFVTEVKAANKRLTSARKR